MNKLPWSKMARNANDISTLCHIFIKYTVFLLQRFSIYCAYKGRELDQRTPFELLSVESLLENPMLVE